MSKRAQLSYAEEPATGKFSKWLQKGKKVFRGATQKLKNVTRQGTSFMDEKLTDWIPGFVILVPHSVELTTELDGKSITVIGGVGAEAKKL